MSKLKKWQRKIHILLISFLLLIPLFLIALSLGRYSLSLKQLWQGLFQADSQPLIHNLLMDLRLPRIVAALIIGASLAMAGLAFQDLFNNPLVSPDLLGVANGASVGAGLAIICGGSIWLTQINSFIFGLIAVSLTLLLTKIISYSSPTLTLVLSGIVVSGFMQAIFGLIKYLADPDSQLQSIVYWQLGSLTKIDYQNLSSCLPAFILAFLIIILLRWHLTILSLGEANATSSGLNVKLERFFIIFAATLLTASSVCLAGNIAWIGLVVPHMARRLIGANARFSLPLAGILGAGFLLIIDTLARTIATSEIPLSILTGFIGTPLFIYLLARRKK